MSAHGPSWSLSCYLCLSFMVATTWDCSTVDITCEGFTGSCVLWEIGWNTLTKRLNLILCLLTDNKQQKQVYFKQPTDQSFLQTNLKLDRLWTRVKTVAREKGTRSSCARLSSQAAICVNGTPCLVFTDCLSLCHCNWHCNHNNSSSPRGTGTWTWELSSSQGVR